MTQIFETKPATAAEAAVLMLDDLATSIENGGNDKFILITVEKGACHCNEADCQGKGANVESIVFGLQQNEAVNICMFSAEKLAEVK